MVSAQYFDPAIKEQIDKQHNVRPFIEAEQTKEKLDILELEAIDLSKYQDGPEGLAGRRALAKQLELALTTYGFFKLIGHGISDETISRLKSIGQGIFEIPDEEKKDYIAGVKKLPLEQDRELGIVRGVGFKPRGHWQYQNNVNDNVEFFNVRHFLHDDIFFNQTDYPEFVKYHLDEISTYFKYLHFEVLRKVVLLIEIILEVPEGEIFDNIFKKAPNNDIDNSGGGFGRFLLYHEVDEEYSKLTNGTWLRGHTDATALTFIISQPIVSLQIRDYADDKWKYVSHTPHSLIVNIGDAFKYMTGSYFKSSIHRVTTPPKDQAKYKRNTVIYFSDPSWNTIMDPSSLKSPKLQRLNIGPEPGVKPVTFGEWDEAKGKFLNSKSRNTNSEVNLLGRTTLMSLVNDKDPLAIKSA